MTHKLHVHVQETSIHSHLYMYIDLVMICNYQELIFDMQYMYKVHVVHVYMYVVYETIYLYMYFYT